MSWSPCLLHMIKHQRCFKNDNISFFFLTSWSSCLGHMIKHQRCFNNENISPIFCSVFTTLGFAPDISQKGLKKMIALKGAIRDCLRSSQMRRELSPTRTLRWPGRNRVPITCNTSSAYHVQHVVSHVVGGDSSAIKFDKAEFVFIPALFYWLKPLTDEGGDETGGPRQNP